jgi:hypothetical protein
MSKYITLISGDGFEFVVLREAATKSPMIRKMLDPASKYRLLWGQDADDMLTILFLQATSAKLKTAFALLRTSGMTSSFVSSFPNPSPGLERTNLLWPLFPRQI